MKNTHIGHKHFGVQRTLNTQAIQERGTQTVRIERLVVIELVVQVAQIIEIIEVSTVVTAAAAAIVSAIITTTTTSSTSSVVPAAATVAIVVSTAIAIIPAKHKRPNIDRKAITSRKDTQHQQP